MQNIIIFTDGGSRGNPGPAASGAVIANSDGTILQEYGQFLGKATNNEAEYQALILGLKKARALFGKAKAKKMDVEIKSDSELMVRQMNGEYKIENSNIQPLFLKARNLAVDFADVSYTAIPRAQNTKADHLVNQTLDAQTKSQKLF